MVPRERALVLMRRNTPSGPCRSCSGSRSRPALPDHQPMKRYAIRRADADACGRKEGRFSAALRSDLPDGPLWRVESNGAPITPGGLQWRLCELAPSIPDLSVLAYFTVIAGQIGRY